MCEVSRIKIFQKPDCNWTPLYWLDCANYKPPQWESKEKESCALSGTDSLVMSLVSNKPFCHSFRLQKLEVLCAQGKMLRVSCG